MLYTGALYLGLVDRTRSWELKAAGVRKNDLFLLLISSFFACVVVGM